MTTNRIIILLSLMMASFVPLESLASSKVIQDNKNNLILKFGLPGDEVIVSPNDILSMGNHGSYSALLSYNLIIENKGSKSIDISNFQLTNPESNITVWALPVLSVAPDKSVTISIFYETNGNIESVGSGLTFETNEDGFENVKFDLIVNPDKGQMEFTSDLLVSEKTIDLGKVKLNSLKEFTIAMENKGIGFVKFGPAVVIQTSNELALSFDEEETFGPASRVNNDGDFKGIKKGEIKASFSHSTIHGTVDKHVFNVIGQVIAPESQIEFESGVFAHNSNLKLDLKLNELYIAEFKVRNIGDDVLSLHQIKLVGKEKNEIFVFEGNSGTVQPGEVHKAKLYITPRQLGDYKVQMSFITNDYQRSETLINLNLLVKGPAIVVKNEAGKEIGYNTENQFGICTDGQTFTQKLVLENSGSDDLNLSKIEIIGGDQNNLKLINRYPPTLLPGQSANLELEYTAVTPRRVFEKYALRIQSNALNWNDFICDLIVQNHFSQVELNAQNIPILNNSLYKLEQTSVNEPKVFNFTIENNGTVDLDIEDISILDDGLNYFTISQKPDRIIKPGELGDVKISFAPKLKKYDYTAKLQVKTNDYLLPVFTMNMEGDAVKPKLVVWQTVDKHAINNNETINYGKRTYPDNLTEEYFIKNESEGQLKFSDLKIEASNGLLIEWEGNKFGTLDNGESASFKVKYQFDKMGDQTARISFNTNDYNHSNFEFTAHFYAQIPEMEVYVSNKLDNNSTLKFEGVNEKVLRIKNIGNYAIYFNKLNIEGKDKDVFEFDFKEKYVREGEEAFLKVRFIGNEAESYKAVLRLETNDKNNTVFLLNLERNLVKPKFEMRQASTDEKINNGASLDYGNQIYPNERTEKYIIKNESLGQLKLTNISIEASDGLLVDLEGADDITVGSGESSSIKVKYQCFEKGDQSARISFKTNDYDNPNFEFSARFYAEISEMEVYASNKLDNNSTLKFEDTNEKVLQIKNIGNYDICINEIIIKGYDKDMFSFDFNEKYIRSGEEESLKLKFNAEASGKYEAMLHLETNDKNDPIYEINLTGIKSIYTGIVPGGDEWEPVVYPNPFKDVLRITNLQTEPSDISIYTLSGVKIYSERSYQKDLSIHFSLPAGIYLLEIKCKDQVKRVKIVRII